MAVFYCFVVGICSRHFACTIHRVPTNLESQGKPGKKRGQGKSGNVLNFFKKFRKVSEHLKKKCLLS